MGKLKYVQVAIVVIISLCLIIFTACTDDEKNVSTKIEQIIKEVEIEMNETIEDYDLLLYRTETCDWQDGYFESYVLITENALYIIDVHVNGDEITIDVIEKVLFENMNK